MTETKSPESFENLDELVGDYRNRCQEEFKRYNDTIALFSGLFWFFKEHPEMISTFFFGKKLKYTDTNGANGEITPDIVITSNEKSYGILIEAKWRVSSGVITNELSNIKKYCVYDLMGWVEDGSQVDEHSTVLSCHSDDASTVVSQLETLVGDEPEGYKYLNNGEFALWSWGEAKQRGGREVIRITKMFGEIGHVPINESSISNIDIPQDIFIIERNTVKFVGDRPPIQYVIKELIEVINNIILSGKINQELYVTFEDLYSTFSKLFPSQAIPSNLANIAPNQILKNKLEEACEILHKFNLNLRRMSEKEIEEKRLRPKNAQWYKVKFKFPGRVKGLDEWICKKLSEMHKRELEKDKEARDKKAEKEKERIKIEKGHIKLDEFMS